MIHTWPASFVLSFPPCRGETPLSKAAAYNHTKCVARLLERGADPNCPDLSNQTPLFKAAFKGHAECVRLLLSGAVAARLSSP